MTDGPTQAKRRFPMTQTPSSNLRLRVMTALVALPMTLFLLFWLPTAWLGLAVFLLLAVGLYEWARLCEASPFATLLLYCVMIAFGPLVFAAERWFVIDLRLPVLFLGSIFWCFALFMVVRFPASGNLLPRVPRGLVGALLLGCAWLALTYLKQIEGEWLIVWLLAVVWIADSGAYFGGRRWGRAKLAVSVSPGKTIEGAVAGVILSVVCGVASAVWLADLFNLRQGIIFWLLVSLVIALLSILGDLFASLLKRLAGAKDSGGLFPGHGGVLDRLDSLLSTAPLLAICVYSMS